MNYIAEPGIMLDVLEYSMIYFNQAVVKQREMVLSELEADSFQYYDLFRTGKRRLDPPASFYPFFNFKQKYLDFFPLFKYFWEFYNFEENNPAEFLESLRSENFRRFCFNYYLQDAKAEIDIESVIKGEPKNCMRAIAMLSAHKDNLFYFVDFFGRFGELAEELAEYMTKLYSKLAAFHEKIDPELISVISNNFTEYEYEIKHMLSIADNTPITDKTFTIILMEHLSMLLKPYDDKKKILFFVGANSKSSILRWGDYSNISLVSFGQAFGNEVKYEIIQELRKGECTVSQLSKKLFISRSTVDRCLLSLSEGLVVLTSKKVGTEIFYALNPTYIWTARQKIKYELDEIWEDISRDGLQDK